MSSSKATSKVDEYRTLLEEIRAKNTKRSTLEETTLSVLIDILEALSK